MFEYEYVSHVNVIEHGRLESVRLDDESQSPLSPKHVLKDMIRVRILSLSHRGRGWAGLSLKELHDWLDGHRFLQLYVSGPVEDFSVHIGKERRAGG